LAVGHSSKKDLTWVKKILGYISPIFLTFYFLDITPFFLLSGWFFQNRSLNAKSLSCIWAVFLYPNTNIGIAFCIADISNRKSNISSQLCFLGKLFLKKQYNTNVGVGVN